MVALFSGLAVLPLAAGQPHAIPNVVLHSAFGATVAAAAAVPPLRNSDSISAAYWITVLSFWGITTIVLFALEALRRPTALERKMLSGSVLFMTLNLLGTLSATPSLDSVINWGPLALTASLCVASVLMDATTPPEQAGVVASAVGGVRA